MKNCLFCKIVNNEIPNWKIWEDENHIAFLTPFPNTKGFTVLITKVHYDSYAFDLDQEVYIRLCLAAKEVGKLLDEQLHTKRTGFIFEGMGVNHIHAKLIPMHHIPEGKWQAINSNAPEFFEQYEGYITSKDGPEMDTDLLDAIQEQITK